MLKKETFDFLNLIAANNNREWFASNKHLYEEAKEDLFPFIAKLIKEFSAIDPHYAADTEPKKALMRIYRDVRFSKNKDPYKLNYGIAFDVKGYGP
ncbi:MAG: TIGR02453 family protein, partial [Flavobacterium sp.]